MKRIFLIIILFSCTISNAQYKKYKLSWVGTFNLNKVTPINNQRTYIFGANGLNYSMGFRFKYGLLKNNKLGLSLSTLFTKVAYRSNANVEELNNPTIDFNSSYFQIPFAVSWSLYKTRHFDVNIPIGVIPSFLIGTKSQFANGDGTIPSTLKNLMGYQAGVEVFYTKNLKFFLAFKPNFVFYPKAFDQFESQKAYTFQFLINAGYMF
jgi:hypothetical protein